LSSLSKIDAAAAAAVDDVVFLFCFVKDMFAFVAYHDVVVSHATFVDFSVVVVIQSCANDSTQCLVSTATLL
jgi:hypothetical protein